MTRVTRKRINVTPMKRVEMVISVTVVFISEFAIQPVFRIISASASSSSRPHRTGMVASVGTVCGSRGEMTSEVSGCLGGITKNFPKN